MMIADAQVNLVTWWGPALAFLAGAVSFASPCVFPLVPGYVSFVTGGRAVGVTGEPGDRRSAVVPILLFIVGFSIVFVLIGAFSSTFVRVFRGPVVRYVGGGFVIAMGLLMLGYALQRGPLALYAERRPLLERIKPGPWGALPLGVAFGAGWVPCTGPVLTGIVVIAATQSVGRGVVLLSAYSLGLGLPFLLVGLGAQRLAALEWVRRRYAWVAGVSGVLLVTMGVLLVTGRLIPLLAPLQRYAPFGL